MEYTTLGALIKPAKTIRCGDGNYPVLSMTMHDGIMLQSDRFKKSLASVDQSNYKVVKRGQLVIGFPIDEGVLYLQEIEDEGIMSPAYNVWDINTDLIEPKFLEFCLHSPQAMSFYKNNLRGSTARRRTIPTDVLLSLPIPKIDFEKQKRATEIITRCKYLKDIANLQLEQLDQLVKSRFVEMFGNKGYPILKWNNVFETKTGKLDSNAMVENGAYPFFTCSKEILRIDNYAYDQEALLLAGNNAAGKYDVKYYKGKFNAYQRTYILSLKQNWSYQLFKYQLEDKLDYLQEQSLGGLTKYLTMKILEKLEFIIPPFEEQKLFDNFVQQVDKSKFTIKQSLEQLELLKKKLMQDYFG